MSSKVEYQFSPTEAAQIRQQAQQQLAQLQQQLPTTANNNDTTAASLIAAHGFVQKRQFCTWAECQAMKQEMQRLVDEDWDPTAGGSLDSFGTDAKANTARGDYFLESADKIHFFAEPIALETNTQGVQVLKAEYQGPNRIQALNKVGHALHLNPHTAFGQYFRSPKLRQFIQQELQWQDPVVPQSMYIFKQAQTGGAVYSHQDSTFLYTTPRQTCLGLWLALDDATIDNGCLWVRPGSHVEAVRRQYCRNPQHFGPDAIQARSNEAGGDLSAPKFVMNELVVDQNQQQQQPHVTWDGQLPEGGWQGLFDAGFVPIECQAGDLLAFTGTLDHLSLPNVSNQARHTFQLHAVEGPQAGITWSPSNWLQYPDGRPFAKVVE